MCDLKQLAQKMLLVLIIYTNFKHLMDIYNLKNINNNFLAFAFFVLGSTNFRKQYLHSSHFVSFFMDQFNFCCNYNNNSNNNKNDSNIYD